MGNILSRLIVGLLATALAMPLFAADRAGALLAPFSPGADSIGAIPDGYFEPVALNGAALFADPPHARHDLVLPRLGRLAIEHDRTLTLDLGGVVTRWEGHVAGHAALKVTFVKGISGMVSGVIDTPRGRVLLGQAGDYILYKQSNAAAAPAPAASTALPQALVQQPLAPNSPAERAKPAAVAYPVQFNAAALANVPLNGEVELALPDAGEFRVVHDNTLGGDLGATTFVGYLKDFGNDFRMIVTYSPSGAQGQILTPYGMYLIQTIGRQQWLIDVDASDLHHVVPSGNDGLGAHDPAPAPALAGAAAQTGTAAATAASGPTPPATAAAVAGTLKTRIDVLVAYTPGLETRYGGADQVKTRIQNLVALANQAYVDSGVEITLRLAGVVKVDAPDDSSNMDTLNAITNGSGPYGNIAWLRNAYGADLVSLVRPFSMAQGGLCGISWVGGSNGASIALYRDQGYSVVSDGRDGGYFCSAYTFAHELGHNMGNVHDRATVAQQNGSHGAYPYSFGYGVAGQFGTIMSYIDPEVGKFSSPDILCKGQAACGVPETDSANSADNARSLNNTRTAVAAYTPEATAAVQMISIAGVVTADGKALSGVRFNTSAPATCSASGDNGSYSCIVAADWSGDISPSLAGYSFTPESIHLGNLQDNGVDQNFTATPDKTLSLTTAASPSTSAGGGGALGCEALAFMALLAGLRARSRSSA